MTRDIPYKKLNTFRQWLGVEEEDLRALKAYSDLLVGRKDEFARYFYDYFMNIPEARLIIEHEERPGYLLQAWSHWFEVLFAGNLDDAFLAYLWRIGIRHEEIKLDKRFSNMGFAVVRKFCRKVILDELPSDEAVKVLGVIDALLDFCILVETDAYLETTTRCDMEIIRGIADRIRNPVTIIGGNISRLMKHANAGDPAYPVYEFIFSQSAKCERMVKDIKTYMDVFEREPAGEKISLELLVREVVEKLLATGRYGTPSVEIEIRPDAAYIMADFRDMKALFTHLLENGLEALTEENPMISVSSRRDEVHTHSLVVEIFNTGTPVKTEDMERLFSPFYSTKPEGTGFGLSIALEAARNNLGRIRLQPVENRGTLVMLSLPLYE